MGTLLRRDLKIFTFNPAITSGAYLAIDIMGTLLELPGAILGGGTGYLESVFATTKGKTGHPSLRLVIFSQKPAGTFADNAVFDPSNADLALICAEASFGGTWIDYTTGSSCQVKDQRIPVKAISRDPSNLGKGGSLWAVLVTVGTPTMQSVSDLTINIGIDPC